MYRSVKLFEESGILDRLEFGDGRSRYEDAEREHHDHLIDINTGKVIEFCDTRIQQIQTTMSKLMDFKVDYHSLYFYGICKDCQNSEKLKKSE